MIYNDPPGGDMPNSEDWEWEMPIYQVEGINEPDGSESYTEYITKLFSVDPSILTGGSKFTAKRGIILKLYD